MRKTKYYLLASILASTFLLVACTGSADKTESKTLTGLLQKGAFISGASCTVTSYDSKGIQLGNTVDFTTTKEGEYSVNKPTVGEVFKVSCNGNYKDDVTGKASDTKATIATVGTGAHAMNANVATSLITNKVLTDLSDKSFDDALKAETTQVAKELKLDGLNGVDLTTLDLNDTNKDTVTPATAALFKLSLKVAEGIKANQDDKDVDLTTLTADSDIIVKTKLTGDALDALNKVTKKIKEDTNKKDDAKPAAIDLTGAKLGTQAITDGAVELIAADFTGEDNNVIKLTIPKLNVPEGNQVVVLSDVTTKVAPIAGDKDGIDITKAAFNTNVVTSLTICLLPTSQEDLSSCDTSKAKGTLKVTYRTENPFSADKITFVDGYAKIAEYTPEEAATAWNWNKDTSTLEKTYTVKGYSFTQEARHPGALACDGYDNDFTKTKPYLQTYHKENDKCAVGGRFRFTLTPGLVAEDTARDTRHGKKEERGKRIKSYKDKLYFTSNLEEDTDVEETMLYQKPTDASTLFLVTTPRKDMVSNHGEKDRPIYTFSSSPENLNLVVDQRILDDKTKNQDQVITLFVCVAKGDLPTRDEQGKSPEGLTPSNPCVAGDTFKGKIQVTIKETTGNNAADTAGKGFPRPSDAKPFTLSSSSKLDDVPFTSAVAATDAAPATKATVAIPTPASGTHTLILSKKDLASGSLDKDAAPYLILLSGTKPLTATATAKDDTIQIDIPNVDLTGDLTLCLKKEAKDTKGTACLDKSNAKVIFTVGKKS